jgi:hypothetical protein
MISLGDIADGLSTIAAGKKVYEERVYRDQLLQFILDRVQSSELSSGEKEGIVELLKRETDMKDLLFRAATKSEFLKALQLLGILNINVQNEAQTELLEKLQQSRFEVGASHQQKIFLEKFNDLEMQIQENNQSNLAYQRLLENPIREGVRFLQQHLPSAGIQKINIELVPGARMRVSGGKAVETFYENVKRGKTAELKVGIDGTEMSYFPPQLKDVLGSTPHASLRVEESPQTSTHIFLFCIEELKLKLSARVTHYPDSEFIRFEIVGVSNSVGLTIEINRNEKKLGINLHPAPGNLFTESDLPLLNLINVVSQKSGNLKIESIENPEFRLHFDLLEADTSENTSIFDWTNFCITFLEANRLLKAHSIIQEDLPWLDSDDPIPYLYQLFSRIKDVLLNVRNEYEEIFTGLINFSESKPKIVKEESESEIKIKTERGVFVAGQCRFVEVITFPNPKVFIPPNENLLSRDELKLIWQKTSGEAEIRFEEPYAIYSYRALKETDPSHFYNLLIE